jgi:AraC-like DNA-binding protein
MRFLMMDAECEPHLSLVDVRRVESIDTLVFQLLANRVGQPSHYLRNRISAQALVRPSGFVGAVASGFYDVLEQAYPAEVFTNPYDGLSWLGAGDQTEFVAEIDNVLNRCADASSVLYRLRAHLRHERGNSTLVRAAAALGLSTRELQRQLRDAGTSYQIEQNAAQIRVAKRLLRETTHDIKRIAFDVGCSSAAAFSMLFRKFEGQSPSSWRRSRSEDEQRLAQF